MSGGQSRCHRQRGPFQPEPHGPGGPPRHRYTSVEGRSAPTESLNPVAPSPPKDLRHGTGEGRHVGSRGPRFDRARRESAPLERVGGPLPTVVSHLETENKLPGAPDSSVIGGSLSGGDQFAHEDVLWSPDRRETEKGLGELDAQPAVLKLSKPMRRP